MIWLWISIAVASLAAGLWLSRPFLQRTRVEVDESDAAISIFRDQAEELRQDLKAGLISQEQFDAAEEEIEARTLEAARDMEQGIRISRPSRITAAALCAIIGAATIGLYAFIGSPSVADQPIAARKAEMLTRKAEAGDLNSRIEILIEKTKDNPDSFEDWWMLARSYSATGDHASAADAYRRASEMSGDRPSVLSAYAESLTLANGNKVPRAARVVFEQVLTRTPDPRARYYVALARAQAKDFEGALDDWAALAKDSAPNAPWMQLVRRDIVNMARFLKRDVKPYLPDASEAEVARASAKPEDRAALETRLADLGKALDEDPKNHKGWIERAQLLAALGRQEEAGEAIATGKSHFAAAPFRARQAG